MKKALGSTFLVVAYCVGYADLAGASSQSAMATVKSAIASEDDLVKSYPPLSQVRDVIQTDCADKNAGKSVTSDFCRCASAVTIELWRSGADPNMLPRLVAFIKAPTDEGAKSFLSYQGPELYRPICKLGTK